MTTMKSVAVIWVSASLLLSGCQTATPPVKVESKPIPTDLTRPVAVPAPIDPVTYEALSWNDKEKALTRNVLNLYGALTKANQKLEAIREWDKVQHPEAYTMASEPIGTVDPPKE